MVMRLTEQVLPTASNYRQQLAVGESLRHATGS
jgi:hypothetical protein